ncbi:MAG: hypothetical protein D6809_01075 [Gammaproteobacteria bacterium]|nr:MAG: hypothetical protein D6809_01075 [Gammaproteobacteria bacterium]
MEALYQLQRRLEALYEIPTGHDVRDFLVTERVVARALAGEALPQAPEGLLLRQEGEELALSLYLDRALLARFAAHDPLRRLEREGLEAFCLVLEGVSHFVHLAWRAAQDRPVSLLELELQAEVDKYAVAAALLAEQNRGRVPAWLHRALFAGARFRPELAGEALRRYREADRAAAAFCAALHRELLRGASQQATRALRRFHRLRPAHKRAPAPWRPWSGPGPAP